MRMWGKKVKQKSKNSKLLFSTVACTESARTAVVPQRLCSLIKFWNITSPSLLPDFQYLSSGHLFPGTVSNFIVNLSSVSWQDDSSISMSVILMCVNSDNMTKWMFRIPSELGRVTVTPPGWVQLPRTAACEGSPRVWKGFSVDWM